MTKKHLQSVEITKRSPLTGKANTLMISLDLSDYSDWQQGKLIQKAMPYLSADEREFLISGIIAEEWDTMCGNVSQP